MKRIWSIAIVVFVLTGTQAQDGGTGLLRFVHVIPGVAGVDIYTDGQLTVSNLNYGEASNYIQVNAGTRDVSVTVGGVTTILWEQQINANPDAPQTLIASTIDPLQFVAYDDDFTPVELGTSRFKAIHAINAAEGVDLLVNDEEIISEMQYGDSIGTFDIPANVYSLTAFPTDDLTDDPILPLTPMSLVSNTSNILILYGTPALPESILLTAPLDGSGGLVRLAHAVTDAGEVDIYLDGTLTAAALGFGDITPHLNIDPGSYEAEIHAAGTGESLLSGSLLIEPDAAISTVVLGAGEDVSLEVFNDNVSNLDADTALVRVINTIPGESKVSVSLADGTVLAENLEFGTAADVVSVAPTEQTINFTASIDGSSAILEQPAQQLSGGVYYNALALNSTTFSPPALAFAATSLLETAGSAPGAGDAELVSAPPAAEQPTEAPPQPTPAPEATVQPTIAPTEVVVVNSPTAAPVNAEFPTARILLDPGANLHLRQYPSTDALSLGLAPSGAVLSIIGREGAPVDREGAILPVQDENGNEIEWVDPVLSLGENEDLPADGTWVSVIYNTPDSGQIVAWTVPLYLDIDAIGGGTQRLADLPTVPQNAAGEAINTDVTPPPVRENRVTVRVVNLNPGVNLNMRRTPDASSEVLARLPVGTVIDFIGIGESGEWVFAEFTTADGGFASGWVSTLYIDYEFNGQPISLEDLQQLNLLTTVDEETRRGTVGAVAPDVSQPTRNPLRDAFITTVQLDPGTNLNLRRTPDIQAEVVQQIPTGSTVVITGRTEDETWLQSSFEDVPGWVSSDFVFTITYNGQEVERASIPVVELPSPEDEGSGE